MSKLNRYQKAELIINAAVRRLSVPETQQLVRDKLHVDLSYDYISSLRAKLKENCTKELRSLQQDRDHYLQKMFFDRVEELEYMQRVLHEVIDNNKDHMPETVIRAVSVLHD
jgi:hypothetical protein